MRRPLRVLALAALLAQGPGCFALDELDKGMKQMKETSPRARPDGEVVQPEATADATRPGPSARAELAKWWQGARTPTSGPKDPARASEIVSCRIGGATRFMNQSDCEVQGGTFQP